MIIDLKNTLTTAVVLKSQSVVATATSSGVDLRDYIGSAMIVANVAAATAGTNPTLDIKIQDSADNSSFADVTGYTLTQVTTVDSVQTLSIDTRLARRYIRAVATLGGTSSPAFPTGIVLVGQKADI